MLIDFLLREQCEIRPWLRTDAGEDRYGAPETRACRVQAAPRLQSFANGLADVIPARALMFCTGGMIPERSLVIHGGQTYVVTGCRRARGFGQEHLEVTLQ